MDYKICVLMFGNPRSFLSMRSEITSLSVIDLKYFIYRVSGENENFQQLITRAIASRGEINHKGQGKSLLCVEGSHFCRYMRQRLHKTSQYSNLSLFIIITLQHFTIKKMFADGRQHLQT